MQIQLNSDNHITGSPELQDRVQQMVEHELRYQADQITRVEVHLNDENAAKGGGSDKRCMLEARVRGMQPITTEHHAPTIELAVKGAAEQLSRALKNSFEKAGTSPKHQTPVKHITPGDGEL
jgi:coenzyme F420-reducing hydrogenase gamma subunit